MRSVSEPVAAPEIDDRALSPVVRTRRSPRYDLSTPSAMWATLEPWRSILPLALVVLWIGFSLVPSLHPVLRGPMALLLAGLIGAGAQLSVWAEGTPRSERAVERTLWIVPAGATLAVVALLVAVGSRIAPFTPLFAAAVAASIPLQTVEARGSRGLQIWARPLNTGLAFASAVAGFACAPGLSPPLAAALAALTGALVCLVVLRGSRPSGLELVTYVGVTAFVSVVLGLLVRDTRPLFIAAGVPLLAVYAITTTTQAFLERAPRRAYLEVSLVTGAAFAIAALVLNKP